MNNGNFGKEPMDKGGFDPRDGEGGYTQGPQFSSPLYEQAPPISQRMGTLSLIFGIIGVVCCCCCPILPMIAAILAIIFALVDRSRFGHFRGITVAGLIFGIVGTLFGVYMLMELASAFSLFTDPVFMELYRAAIESGDFTALEEYLLTLNL